MSSMRASFIKNRKASGVVDSFQAGRKTVDDVSPNNICVQLPGNRRHHIVVRDDERISSLRKRIAAAMGVKERNWGIYAPNDNRLKIVDDIKQIDQVDRNKLHFYPKAIIR